MKKVWLFLVVGLLLLAIAIAIIVIVTTPSEPGQACIAGMEECVNTSEVSASAQPTTPPTPPI
ncbi:MAG: hypothetical protein QXE64_01495, partial [Candidatus Pacearchaeota archaeon]